MDVAQVFKSMQYGPAPESTDAAQAWLEENERRFGLFINNSWHHPQEASYYTSYNPSSGEMLADTVQAGQAEVDSAISAAQEAFTTWSKTSGAERARYLYAIARNVQKHARLLAVLESMDNGKPIRESAILMSLCWHAILLPCWLGSINGDRAGRLPTCWRYWADHPLELPFVDAGLEDRPRHCHG
jgi:hypothetical protein